MQAIRSRFNSVVLVLIALMLAGALARGVLGGPLDPPGPPGSTLPQVEPRSPIPSIGWNGTFPITISQPGSYYLTGDITGVSGKDGIHINAHDVTLDLNGFTVSGVAGSYTGVYTDGWNDTVRNGSVNYWGLNGIYGSGSNSTFDGVQARSNGGTGIENGNGSGLVLHCVATNNGNNGIVLNGGVVRDSQASTNNNWGIVADAKTLVLSNTVSGNAGGGIHLSGRGPAVSGNTVADNGQTGIDIAAAGSGAAIKDNVVQNNSGGGILVEGRMNRIEGNNVVGNSPITVPFGIRVTIDHNIIVRNSATFSTDNFDIAAGNTAGPEETSAATSPWSNVNY